MSPNGCFSTNFIKYVNEHKLIGLNLTRTRIQYIITSLLSLETLCADKTLFILLKFFKSKFFSKHSKVIFYTTIIRPTLAYGCVK